jgi:nucleoside-diphosphate-sugar epimerase
VNYETNGGPVVDVFVTGGSGFLGQHLLGRFAKEGYRVRALARSPRAEQAVAANGAEPVSGELTDESVLRDGMAGCDLVVHAAADTSAWGPSQRFHEVNVIGTEAVLAAARQAGVARLVHVSTEAVLADGHPLRNADESWPIPSHHVGDYPRTKALAEQRVLAANGAGLATVVVRPRLVWGPGDTTVLPELERAARSKRFAWIDGGRYNTSTCHVTNVCEGIVLAAERGRAGEVYFLTDGDPVQVREFFTALTATVGVDLGDRSLPRWLVWATAVASEPAWRLLPLPGQPPVTRTAVALAGQEMTVNDAKARRELGYQAVVDRPAGLAALAGR